MNPALALYLGPGLSTAAAALPLLDIGRPSRIVCGDRLAPPCSCVVLNFLLMRLAPSAFFAQVQATPQLPSVDATTIALMLLLYGSLSVLAKGNNLSLKRIDSSPCIMMVVK